MHITQELGVDPDDQPSPWTAAIARSWRFSVGGIFPLVSYLLGSLVARSWRCSIGAVGLFVGGRDHVPVHHALVVASGLRQLMFGAIAAGATYLVGMAIGVSAG